MANKWLQPFSTSHWSVLSVSFLLHVLGGSFIEQRFLINLLCPTKPSLCSAADALETLWLACRACRREHQSSSFFHINTNPKLPRIFPLLSSRLKQRRADYRIMVQLKPDDILHSSYHSSDCAEYVWAHFEHSTAQWDVISVSVRTIKALGRNDTKQKITKNISTGKKEENDPDDTAFNLRAALSQWDLNCTADAFFPYICIWGWLWGLWYQLLCLTHSLYRDELLPGCR